MKTTKIKICPKCRENRTMADFSRDTDSIDGYYYKCKECAKAATKKFRNKIKEGTIQAF